MGKKIVFIILIFLPCTALFSQDSHFNWEGAISGKGGANATIRVFSDGRMFLFAANDEGNVNISYFRPTALDSILITSMGHKPRKLSIHELRDVKEIQLEEDIYSLSEVIVAPANRRRTRATRLGNRALYACNSINNSFETQQGLLIRYGEARGRILRVRYYMNCNFRENMHLRPFRVMIYDMDTLNNMPGKNLLNEYLIVSLNNRGLLNNIGRWLEVDISHYNIELPPKGVFVGMEILPFEYYLSNNIITNQYVRDSGVDAVNSVSVGVTSRSTRAEPSYESWINTAESTKPEWKRTHGDFDFLINIVVEVNR